MSGSNHPAVNLVSVVSCRTALHYLHSHEGDLEGRAGPCKNAARIEAIIRQTKRRNLLIPLHFLLYVASGAEAALQRRKGGGGGGPRRGRLLCNKTSQH